jgi:transcriptional regulator
MSLPRVFESTPPLTRDLLREHPFATIAYASPAGAIEMVHVPLLVDFDGDGAARELHGHVARANPFVRAITAGAEITAAFHGPDAYVSASLYGQPREQVPTWNYAIVHVRGQLRALDDAETTRLMTRLSERFEQGPEPWHPGLLDPDFFADLRRGIVGFSVAVSNVSAKLKMSQNRSADDRARVEKAFAASSSARDLEVARLMQRLPREQP